MDLTCNPARLLKIHDDIAISHRHPKIDKPYFYEFYEIKDHISDKFDKCITMDSFFDPYICPSFFVYVDSLIENAKARPVLQCCRSFGRVKYLKNRYMGLHLYLWRDPRDQWLSYQINDYFDVSNLAIVNALNPPSFIQRIRREIGFQEIRRSSLALEYDELTNFPINSQNRYLVFYALWLYGLLENMTTSDLDINITRLSNDADYQNRKINELETLGITGISLSTCSSPLTSLTETENNYFTEIEKIAHNILLESGYSNEAINAALRYQQDHHQIASNDAISILESSKRARKVAFRYADRLANSNSQLRDYRAQLEQLRGELTQVREQSAQAVADALKAQAGAYQTVADAFRVEAEAIYAKAETLRGQQE